MDLQEVQQFFESSKDDSKVQDYLKGLEKPTLDSVKNLVQNDKDFRSWLDSEKDTHYNKALEKWKSKDLQNVLEEEIKKRYPEKDSKDIQIAELSAKFEKMEQEKVREALKNSAITTLTEKKLPLDITDLVIGSDLDTTTKNIEKMEQALNKYVEAILKEKGKDTYVPPLNNNTNINNTTNKNDVFSILQGAKHRK